MAGEAWLIADKIARYRALAVEARRNGTHSRDEAIRYGYQLVAVAWDHLADELEKEGRETLKLGTMSQTEQPPSS